MFDKPLFSRRQLSIIIFVTTIAIVLLTASGQRDALPEIHKEQQHGVPIYWLQQDTASSYLSLSFALPKGTRGDSATVRLVQQLLLDSLRQSFAQQSLSIKLNSHSDRLEITLIAATEQSIASVLSRLFKQLQAPDDVVAKWSELQKKQQAQQYLDRQSVDPGWAKMRLWLQPEQSQYDNDYMHWSAFREQLFSRSQLSVSLMAKDVEPIVEALRSQLSSIPNGLQWANPSTPSLPPQQLTASTLGEYQLLLGRQTSGRSAVDFAEQLLAVRQLQTLAGALHIYSEWRPLGSHSELILSASSPSPIDSNALLGSIKSKLAETSDDELDRRRSETIDHLYQRLENPDQLFEQLQAIAFYQLPENYLQSFVSQLDQLSSAALRSSINALLNPEHYHQISQQPAN
ncbi:MAG: hypothetical protein V7739_03675 [Motiliproteus sp.]